MNIDIYIFRSEEKVKIATVDSRILSRLVAGKRKFYQHAIRAILRTLADETVAPVIGIDMEAGSAEVNLLGQSRSQMLRRYHELAGAACDMERASLERSGAL